MTTSTRASAKSWSEYVLSSTPGRRKSGAVAPTSRVFRRAGSDLAAETAKGAVARASRAVRRFTTVSPGAWAMTEGSRVVVLHARDALPSLRGRRDLDQEIHRGGRGGRREAEGRNERQ